jgi:hypothetical protein
VGLALGVLLPPLGALAPDPPLLDPPPDEPLLLLEPKLLINWPIAFSSMKADCVW